ncbi:MAG: tripartite tricarboxylate transporter TctB family protein, partial [Actinomycetota bacterium]|nr:tripartite tricarboxylate transporter TctB family protein [Actinomycetota bacterium]
VALFFVGLFVFGLYVVVPLFCLAYLRLVARSSWLVAAVYAAVALVALYVPLTYLLRVPVPEGLFG